MKSIIWAAVIASTLTIGVQAFAWAPSVNGRMTYNGEDANGKFVAVGGEAHYVNDSKQNMEDYLQQEIYDLQKQLNALPTDCSAN